MLKSKMYVRCPMDKESSMFPRIFVCGQVLEIDPYSNTAKVEIYDPFENMIFFEDLTSGILEYDLNSLNRCSLFVDSVVLYHGEKHKVLYVKLNDKDYHEYYLQNVDTKKVIKTDESQIIAAFNNDHIRPLKQLLNYELQNPVWFFGRNTVSRNISLLNSSVFGFKELAGCKIYLMPHQLNSIMRCLQDYPCRYMLADEVGMGKTIEAISIIKLFLINNSKKKILIAVPDTLVEQWKTELLFKFNLSIGNNINDNKIYLYGYSKLGSSLCAMNWDFVIVDEVHKLIKDENMNSKIHELSKNSENILLLSATPVQERKEEYLALLRLLNPGKYDQISLEEFSELLIKQEEIIEQTSFVLDDLEDYEDVIEKAVEEGKDPLEEEDCQDLFEEMMDYLNDICDCLEDEKLTELLGHISIDSEDMGVYAIKVMVSYICGNYQVENNIIRNRREMLETDDEDEKKLPVRELVELKYSFDNETNTEERSTYTALIDFIENEIEKTDENINEIIKPLLTSFFSTSAAFLSCAKRLLKNNEDAYDILDNATTWYAKEKYLVDNIETMMDDFDDETDDFSRITQVINFVLQVPMNTKILLFTDFDESFSMYRSCLNNMFDADEYAVFGRKLSAEKNELEAYKFQTNPDCMIMLCDSSGGEGRNFQCADYIIHIDLPWNANQIEQRIGRLDRLERAKDRSVVTSVVPYVEDTFEESLFRFWKNGLKIFNHSLSGMEIIMHDINDEIHSAIKEDFKYGLARKIDKIVEKTESLRKKIKKEQKYDAASYIFRPMYNELSNLVNYYNKYENELFTNTMTSWASLAGFQHGYSEGDVITYVPSRFSLKSAENAQLIPPEWEAYQSNKQMQLMDQIQEEYEKKMTKDRIIRGTFVRQKAIENDYIHFFAPGDPIFDCIVDNALKNSKGQTSAFEVKSNFNWEGFAFTWTLTPAEEYMYENNIPIVNLNQFRNYLGSEQIVTFATLSNPDNVTDREVKKMYDFYMNLPMLNIKKYVKHLGKRSGVEGLVEIIKKYPKDKWNHIVIEANNEALSKAMVELKKHMNLRGAKLEMQRSLSAMEAKGKYYNQNSDQIENLKMKQQLIFKALKESKVTLESVAYVKMVSKDE